MNEEKQNILNKELDQVLIDTEIEKYVMQGFPRFKAEIIAKKTMLKRSLKNNLKENKGLKKLITELLENV